MSNNDDQLKLIGCIGAFAYMPVLMIVGALMYGWALTTLWAWFVVTTFGAAPLTYVQAVGISLIIRLCTYQAINCKEKEEDKRIGTVLAKATLNVILHPLVSVGFAWLILKVLG